MGSCAALFIECLVMEWKDLGLISGEGDGLPLIISTSSVPYTASYPKGTKSYLGVNAGSA